ncbi:MAG: AbrB family transcriptional regulator [Litorivicinaceae bacterium]
MRHSLPLFGAIAAVAAVTFESLNIPLGAMIGPMLIIGLTVHLTKVNQAPGLDAHHFAILLLGLALGSRVTADVFERVKLWPFSLTILIVTMVMILWIVGKLNQRLLALDRISAHMAAAPGNLSSALAVTENYCGALSQVAVYQSLRLAFLTLLVPFLFVVPETPQPIVLFQHTDFIIWLIVLSVSWGLTGLLRVLRVTTPGLIVGVFVGASVNLLEVATLNTPPMFIALAMMLFGWHIGVDTLLKTIPPAAISTLVAITIALIGAYITHRLLGFPFLDAALGFMPGAFQVMPVVALEVGADGLYVTTHHLIRVLAMGMLIPFFASYWSRS